MQKNKIEFKSLQEIIIYYQENKDDHEIAFSADKVRLYKSRKGKPGELISELQDPIISMLSLEKLQGITNESI